MWGLLQPPTANNLKLDCKDDSFLDFSLQFFGCLQSPPVFFFFMKHMKQAQRLIYIYNSLAWRDAFLSVNLWGNRFCRLTLCGHWREHIFVWFSRGELGWWPSTSTRWAFISPLHFNCWKLLAACCASISYKMIWSRALCKHTHHIVTIYVFFFSICRRHSTTVPSAVYRRVSMRSVRFETLLVARRASRERRKWCCPTRQWRHAAPS